MAKRIAFWAKTESVSIGNAERGADCCGAVITFLHKKCKEMKSFS